MGGCYFCGQPGELCKTCGEFLCLVHRTAYFQRAIAASKKAATKVATVVRRVVGVPLPKV
jgi:hypothetical protein